VKRFLQSPTPRLEKSISFYQQSNFNQFEFGGMPFFSDGKLTIRINPERTSHCGLVILTEDTSSFEKKLSAFQKPIKTESGLVTTCPAGIRIYIEKSNKSIPTIEEKTPPLVNSMGFSIECTDMHATVAFNKALDYKIWIGKPEVGWLVMQEDGGHAVSLIKAGACPHLFFNPSVSFFNSKEGNPIIIEGLRKRCIPIAEEIKHFNTEGIVNNVIVRDPGGLGFFIFND
jgi:hypothetical protein